MKHCGGCDAPKDLDAFHRDSTRKDGRAVRCKSCVGKYVKEYHQKHRARRLTAIANSKAERRLLAMKSFVEYMGDKRCLDCGIAEIVVLQFDHVRGKKSANISALVGNAVPWSTVLLEIAKCEIVCANCHTKRTAGRSRWAKVYGLKPLSRNR